MEENNNENQNLNQKENAKVEVKRSNTGIIVLLVIIILILGGCCGYLVYDKLNNEKTTQVAENSKIMETKEKNVIFDYEEFDDGWKSVKELKINGIDYKKRLNEKLWLDYGICQDINVDKLDDFIIISIRDVLYTPFLLIVDYNGNTILNSEDFVVESNNIFKDYMYYGKYNYNKDTKVLNYNVIAEEYGETFICFKDYEASTKLSKNELEKLAKETDYERTYSRKYLGNGKFAEPEKVSSTKFIDNEVFVKEYINNKLSNEAEVEPATAVEGLSSIKVSEIESKIKELKADGYEEVELKRDSDMLVKSDNSNYKYSVLGKFDKSVYIDELDKMFINGKATGYKYKMVLGNEHGMYIVTDDNYLYNPNNMGTMVNSKIKVVLRNDNIFGNLSQTKVIFEDGHLYEYGAS